jgi:hypothetical protein
MSAPVEGIRRVGFRRWYERQLIESHAWLVACFLAIVLVAAGFELLTMERGPLDFAFDAALIGSGLLVCWIAWRRYARLMLVADFIGDQANCPSCAHYGFRFEGVERVPLTILARCPKCGHGWPVVAPPQ